MFLTKVIKIRYLLKMNMNKYAKLLKVIFFFQNNKDSAFSIKELSKKLNINYYSLRRILNNLHKLGYVDYSKHENKKMYFYTGGLLHGDNKKKK